MKNFAGLFCVLVFLCGCSLKASAPGTIQLSRDEQKAAIALAEHRQDIAFSREKLQIEFQANLNHLAEEENSLNLESAQLSFRLKKAHALKADSNYTLNEWRGELVKQ